MSTFTLITIAIIVLLALNSAAVIYLRKTKRLRSAPVRGRAMPIVNVVAIFVMIGLFTAGLAATKLAPDSALSRLISDVGYFVYYAWCMIIAVAIQVVFGLVAHMRGKSDRAG
jgi:hypothetical protein